MDVQDILNSKMGAYLSIFIGRSLPPTLGYNIGHAFSRVLSAFENSKLIRSIRANQWVIHGESLNKEDQLAVTKSVLKHAARCYYDLYHSFSDEDRIKELVPLSSPIESFLQQSADGAGTLVVAPHLSNFDLVVRALATYGFEAKILTHENPRGAYHVQNNLRASSGLDVTPLRDSKVYIEAIDHLKKGGIAATAIDRPVPQRKQKHRIKFFGRPSDLPVGHISMALAADVPITVVAAKMAPDGHYQFLHSGPIPMTKTGDRIRTIIHNAERVLKEVEEFIRLAPEQWLMYYPVWPQTLDEIS